MNVKKIAAVVGIALGTASGTAWAADMVSSIVQPDGTIVSCYQKNNGQLRVVASAEACGPTELSVSWSQQGPKGDKGDKGDTGATGATGAQGPKGDKGDPGAPGANGAPGAKGDKGDKGDTGATGPAGAAGSSGVSGWEVIRASVNIGGLTAHGVKAECSEGKKLLGGGAWSSDADVRISAPDNLLNNSWFAYGYNGTIFTTSMTAYAICAYVS
jgi:hypothetical protein